jgi:zinc transport system substrate-binding protein
MVADHRGTLASLDPANADTYAANAQAYIAQLTELDSYMTETFDGMAKKEFVVFHPAYGYLAEDYGLTMYALQNDGKEATAQAFAELVDLAKADGINTIFSQAEIDSEQPDAFAEEIGGQKVMLAPLAEDYIPNMRAMADAIAASVQ